MMADVSNFDDRPIGVFDSGVGGLTVVSELASRLPDESIIYLGDTARVPYGDKSPDTIIRYALEDAAFLTRHNVKLIVAACNTVSAVALAELKKKVDVPVCGVIEAGAAATAGSTGKIAVIGTPATVASGAYPLEISRVSPALEVECTACPLLVPLAEEGINAWRIMSGVFDIYIGKYKKNPPDALLLGCTHYPLFQKEFERYFSGDVKIISSASACADFVSRLLNDKKILRNSGVHAPERKFFVTDAPEKFVQSAGRFLGNTIDEAGLVVLE
jgi:glutamate racemase